MQGEMLAAVIDCDYTSIGQKLGSVCGSFVQGMVYAWESTEEKACDQLELLIKAAFEAGNTAQKAVLTCKILTNITQNQCFAGILEENQWGKLVIRAIEVLPDLKTLVGNRLYEAVLKTLETALNSVLERVKSEGIRQELGIKLREKWGFLGGNVKKGLSLMGIRFLLGEIVTESVEITREIVKIGENVALLRVFLYFRLIDMGKSPQIADFSACLEASNQLFSPILQENLSIYLHLKAFSPIPTAFDLFHSLYDEIRSEIALEIPIKAEKIAANMRKWTISEEEIGKIARNMMEKDDSSKEAGLTWKSLLSGMKNGEFGRGKMWNELNNTLNRKYVDTRETGKRWRKVVRTETKAPEEEIKAQSQAATATVPLQITHINREIAANPSTETDKSTAFEGFLEPKQSSTVPSEATNSSQIATIYSGPYDSSLNPWDLPDKPLPRTKKPKKPRKSDQNKQDLKPAA